MPKASADTGALLDQDDRLLCSGKAWKIGGRQPCMLHEPTYPGSRSSGGQLTQLRSNSFHIHNTNPNTPTAHRSHTRTEQKRHSDDHRFRKVPTDCGGRIEKIEPDHRGEGSFRSRPTTRPARYRSHVLTSGTYKHDDSRISPRVLRPHPPKGRRPRHGPGEGQL